MPFITQGKTNIKYILIVVILAVIAGGGILGYQYWWAKKEVMVPEINLPEKVVTLEINLKTTKLADISGTYAPAHSEIVFSPDGKQTAYIKRNDNNQWLVVVNDKEGKVYQEIDMTSLTFSPGGKKLAYIALQDDKHFIVVNGEEGKAYDGISSIVFSPDSHHIAYIADMGKPYEKEWRELVVLDGGEQDSYSFVSNLIFSPDSTQLFYIANRGAEWGRHGLEGGESFTVINKKESLHYDTIDHVAFSPDSKQLAYVVVDKGKTFIVVNGSEEKTYDFIKNPTFSPDGKHLTYIANEGIEWNLRGDTVIKEGKWFIVVDNKELKETATSYDIKSINFSSDSRYLADYFYSEYEGTSPTEEMPGEPAVSVTGIAVYDLINNTYVDSYSPTRSEGAIEKFIFNPRNSEERTYTDNSRGMALSVVTCIGEKEIKRTTQSVIDIYYSPDGKSLMYLVGKSIDKKDKRMVIINGREGKAYDEIWRLNFTPNSKYVTYGARDGNELWWIVEEVK